MNHACVQDKGKR